MSDDGGHEHNHMKLKAIVGREYKSKVFGSMLPKLVIGARSGIVVTADKKYMSDEHLTYPEQQFLIDNYLVG